MLSKDQAICIRATDYSETSQIVTLFARDSGKFSAIAKGSKRPKSAFNGPLETLSTGRIVFSSSQAASLATLTEFQPTHILPGLRRNLAALNAALFAAELVGSLTTENDPNPPLYDDFLLLLETCAAADDSPVLRRLVAFQLNLLQHIGSAPVFEQCANCSRPFRPDFPPLFFSSSASGFLCRDCENAFPEKKPVTRQTARILARPRLLAAADEKTLRRAELILIHHFTQLLHRPPKMARHILVL